MSQKQFKRTLLGLYLFHIFMGGIALCVPVIVLFWREHGLSLTQITLLQSFFAALIVLLEVPSGYCADIWGRKPTMVTGAIVVTISTTLYWFADTFWQFMLIEFCWAIGFSFI